MRLIKTLLLIAILGGSTLFAGYATFRGLGVQQAAYPQGISIRDDSVRGARGAVILPGRRGRIHRGGGMSAGK